MKITRIESIPINVPLKPDLTTKTSGGEHVVSPYVIVKMHTDAGLVGLGEATLSPRWSGETSPGCVAAIEGLIAPRLLGTNPTEITRVRQQMDRVLRHNPFTKAAVEMACWDLAGKALDVPLYQLLGGQVRDTIPVKLVVGAFDVPQAVELARKFLDLGARCLKVKVGLDADQDVARVAAVRQEAGPEIPIGIDANQGWDLTTAVRTLARLEGYDMLFAEQPISARDCGALAELRRQTSIPIMADESVFSLSDAWDLGRHRAADVLSVYPGKHGGIAATLEIAHCALAGNMLCSMGSNLELGIGAAAMLHLGAAVPVIASERFPGDFIGPLYHTADMLTEPLPLGFDVARPPTGPGLGVELDEDQLERYRDSSTVARPLG
ncbi:MAG: enolase C-terminal domain-like protein [Planctomycetaceae bacterium]